MVNGYNFRFAVERRRCLAIFRQKEGKEFGPRVVQIIRVFGLDGSQRFYFAFFSLRIRAVFVAAIHVRLMVRRFFDLVGSDFEIFFIQSAALAPSSGKEGKT